MVRAAKSKIAQKEKSDLLYRAILTLKNEEECYSFFQDLCTISELRSMEQRYEVATLLNDKTSTSFLSSAAFTFIASTSALS